MKCKASHAHSKAQLLGDIAVIRAGHHLRRSVDDQVKAGYLAAGRREPRFGRIVQIADVRQDESLDYSRLAAVDLADVAADAMLRRGDVLLVGRGARSDAVALEAEINDAVAGAQLFVIRPEPMVSPQFLAWFLNRQTAQRYLRGNKAGSLVQILTKETLSRLPVTVPSLEIQDKIVKIHWLSVKEARLMDDIKQKKRVLVETTLLRSLQAHEQRP
ncbi:MAG TPA: restriction endonuclease subunit S [Blastocatellia bacterium]